MDFRYLIGYLLVVVLTIFILFLPYILFDLKSVPDENTVRVMTYSSFIQKWGVGPKIARLFEKETGIKVQWINAGNAGLIMERLKFKNKMDRPDVVVGFDQFSVHEAKKFFEWLDLSPLTEGVDLSLLPKGFQSLPFIAYNWGPLSFIYREGEIRPPGELKELLEPEYRGSLILQDPRMSSPGLQFLIWILTEMGETEGFEFLEKLKDSIKIVSPSWSNSYSLFKIQKSTMVFSYTTSLYYHQIEEETSNYKAVLFENAHPVQVEYAGVPDFCRQCDKGRLFIEFLLREDVQKIIMKNNYMYPVLVQALEGSQFQLPKGIKYFSPVQSHSLIKKKRELVNRWKKIFY